MIGNESTPDLDTGWIDWYEDYPHPNDFFQPLLAGESILPTNNTNTSHTDDPELNAKITKLSEEQLGPKQEAEYAELDKEFMEQAPWAPYGTRTLSTFVSDAINLDRRDLQPDLRAVPDQLRIQVEKRPRGKIGAWPASPQERSGRPRPTARRPAPRRKEQAPGASPCGACAATGWRSPSSASSS